MRTRDATLRRISENNREHAGDNATDQWAGRDSDTMRHLLDNLFGADEKPRRK